MNTQATRLSQAVEQRKDFLKNELLKMGYFKTPENKQLYELNLSELEQIHINVKAQFGKELSKEEGV
ncbi:Fur-regulated basic protein FbpA [Metabacillus bambusae]|uniref:Fur-regulated basic protein FbpA n=1 Tax=Metabacillus bambusae TaxID=2795218 RepID=A0ABS3NBJ4_9BACI|nr:Fur-regulated basic protein FbpA [Metabacillus bambusae]MBO1515577.1 Fur-regulated basic protein FbpA [Metabacillus bambusae]